VCEKSEINVKSKSMGVKDSFSKERWRSNKNDDI